MKMLRLLPRVRTLALAAMVGTMMASIGLLAGHYGMKSARNAAENRQLKGEVRDLVSRVVEVEGVLQEVGKERQVIDDLTMATLGGVIDTAAIDAEQSGRVYQALRGAESDEQAAKRVGPNAADANYPALVARMATLREEGKQLVTSLRATAKSVGRRQAILAAIPSRLPAKGWLSSEFGVRNSPFHSGEVMHYGLDIAAEEGTPVYAPADGVVTFASVNGTFGKLVKIDHDFGISTRFAHNSELLVKKGAHVHRGDAIAVIGSTGRSTGPHVHYEILLHGKPVDPARFVLDQPMPSPLSTATASAPRNFVLALPNGTGGDGEPEEVGEGGVMTIAKDPDADPLDHQDGIVPWFDGERLLMLTALPSPLAKLTTTDLYLLIAFLFISTLVVMVMRVPEAAPSESRFAHRLLQTEKPVTSTGYPISLGWSLRGTKDEELDDEE